jgi:hypothetical protein
MQILFGPSNFNLDRTYDEYDFVWVSFTLKFAHIQPNWYSYSTHHCQRFENFSCVVSLAEGLPDRRQDWPAHEEGIIFSVMCLHLFISNSIVVGFVAICYFVDSVALFSTPLSQ